MNRRANQRSSKRQVYRLMIGTIASLALVATGCGSSSKAGVGTPTTRYAANAASTKSLSGVYKLMVIAPLTASPSYPAAYPEMLTGAQAAAKEINDSGGVNGRAIEIVACDTKGDPNAATNCAQTAVQTGVMAVVGALDNAANYTTTLANGGVPNIAPYASVPVLQDPNSFPLYGGQLIYTIGSLSILASRPGVSKIAVLYQNVGPLGAQLQAISKLLASGFPRASVHLIPISPTQGDYSPIVDSAMQDDAIDLATPSGAMVKFLQAATQAGLKKPVSVPSAILLQGSNIQQLGSLSDRLLMAAAFHSRDDTSNPAVAKFDAAMNAVDPSASKSEFSENAYAGVELFAKVAAGMDPVTTSNLTAKLRTVNGVDLGLLPPVQFTQPYTGFPGMTRVFNPDVVYEQVEAGKVVATGGFVNALQGK